MKPKSEAWQVTQLWNNPPTLFHASGHFLRLDVVRDPVTKQGAPEEVGVIVPPADAE